MSHPRVAPGTCWLGLQGCSSFTPPPDEWFFCLSVPQLPAAADGDPERHHPALRALHQAQRRETPLQVSGTADEQMCSALEQQSLLWALPPAEELVPSF